MAAAKKTALRVTPEIKALLNSSPSPVLAQAQLQLLLEASGAAALDKISAAERQKLFRLLGSSAFLSEV
jgi:hypothetical protein